MASVDMNRGDYDLAREKFQMSLEVNQQIGDERGEAAAWHALASVDMNRGNYDLAQEMYQKALEMRQQIGDKTGVAATWHALATIDVERDNYDLAHERYQKSLEISQQIGDKAGEAATFAGIGVMAAKEGHTKEGLRLVALGATIMDSIGHANLEQIVPWINGLASTLGYSQERIEAMYEETAKAYRQDKGWGLVEAALGAR
ncbi:MAG: tetratricopeptide repeat protein [Euryarchaeota archaeon]|nr:tetratricopeptide repeat protein [Euryarchaeota archaeon]